MFRALLVIEDFTELSRLRAIIPICCAVQTHSKRGGILAASRSGTFDDYIGVDFTHGLCPECLKTALRGIHRNESSHLLNDVGKSAVEAACGRARRPVLHYRPTCPSPLMTVHVVTCPVCVCPESCSRPPQGAWWTSARWRLPEPSSTATRWQVYRENWCQRAGWFPALVDAPRKRAISVTTTGNWPISMPTFTAWAPKRRNTRRKWRSGCISHSRCSVTPSSSSAMPYVCPRSKWRACGWWSVSRSSFGTERLRPSSTRCFRRTKAPSRSSTGWSRIQGGDLPAQLLPRQRNGWSGHLGRLSTAHESVE